MTHPRFASLIFFLTCLSPTMTLGYPHATVSRFLRSLQKTAEEIARDNLNHFMDIYYGDNVTTTNTTANNHTNTTTANNHTNTTNTTNNRTTNSTNTTNVVGNTTWTPPPPTQHNTTTNNTNSTEDTPYYTYYNEYWDDPSNPYFVAYNGTSNGTHTKNNSSSSNSNNNRSIPNQNTSNPVNESSGTTTTNNNNNKDSGLRGAAIAAIVVVLLVGTLALLWIGASYRMRQVRLYEQARLFFRGGSNDPDDEKSLAGTKQVSQMDPNGGAPDFTSSSSTTDHHDGDVAMGRANHPDSSLTPLEGGTGLWKEHVPASSSSAASSWAEQLERMALSRNMLSSCSTQNAKSWNTPGLGTDESHYNGSSLVTSRKSQREPDASNVTSSASSSSSSCSPSLNTRSYSTTTSDRALPGDHRSQQTPLTDRSCRDDVSSLHDDDGSSSSLGMVYPSDDDDDDATSRSDLEMPGSRMSQHDAATFSSEYDVDL